MIRISRPRMQNMRISQELNITHFQHHMQAEPVASLLKDLESLVLGIGQGRNDSGVGEAVQGPHVVWVPLCVDAAVFTALQVDDACANEFFLAFACFAFAVEVPDWFG